MGIVMPQGSVVQTLKLGDVSNFKPGVETNTFSEGIHPVMSRLSGVGQVGMLSVYSEVLLS